MSLLDLWKKAVADSWQAEQSSMEFQAARAAKRKELLVPPGYDIDVLGDGTVKPADQCAKVLKP